jgi:aconitase A
MAHNLFDTLQQMHLATGASGRFYSLPALERAGVGSISRLPVSIRIVLESVLRNLTAAAALHKLLNPYGTQPLQHAANLLLR